MKAESLRLTALFFAVTILLTTTLTKLIITLPEAITTRQIGTGGNPALRTPVALFLVSTLILLLYALSRQRYLRYFVVGESKKKSWLNYLGWVILLIAAYYYFTKSPELPKVTSNNTTVIFPTTPEEGTRPSSSPLNVSSPSTAPAGGGWTSFLNALPLLAVVILILIFLTSEKLVEVVSPRKREIEIQPSFVEISGSPREAIVKVYRNAVVFLMRKGYPYRESWTHREHEKYVSSDLGGSALNLSSLVSLFEIAKYSRKRVNQKDVSTAIMLYEKLTKGVEDERT